MENTLCARIETLLRQDPVPNVMALKFLSLLGDKSEGGCWNDGDRWTTWFHYPPKLFPFDAQTYGDRTQIVYWNANDVELAGEAAVLFPVGGLVKVSTDPCLTLAQGRWPLANTFLWFSSDRPVTPGPHPVETLSEPAEALVALSAENGYSPQALAEQHARGCRWFIARLAGVVEALCFVQPNYGHVWEVSGVITRAESRGRGLAKSVVAAAVNDLVGRGLTPRYFVHDRNAGSPGWCEA
jgi:hypothetical protein